MMRYINPRGFDDCHSGLICTHPNVANLCILTRERVWWPSQGEGRAVHEGCTQVSLGVGKREVQSSWSSKVVSCLPSVPGEGFSTGSNSLLEFPLLCQLPIPHTPPHNPWTHTLMTAHHQILTGSVITSWFCITSEGIVLIKRF